MAGKNETRVDIVKGDTSGIRSIKELGDTADKTSPRMSKMQSAVSGLGDRMADKLGPRTGGIVQNAMNSVAGAIGKIPAPVAAVGAGVAVAGAAIAKFALDGVGKFQDLAQSAISFSRSAGVSVDQGSRIIAMADDFGVSAEAAEKSVAKLTRTVDSAPQKFEEYGVAIAKTKDGSTDVVGTLENLAEQFSKTADPARRLAMVQDLLGKSGSDLIPIIARGGEKFRELAKAVSDAQIITESEAEDSEKYRAAMDDLGDSVQDLQVELGQKLVPAIAEVATVGADLVSFLNDAADAAGSAFAKLGPVADFIKRAVNPIGTFREAWRRLRDEAKDSELDIGDVSAGVAGLQDAVAAAVGPTADLAEGTDRMAVAAKQAADALAELEDALADSLGGTVSAEQAAIRYAAAIDDAAASLNENGTTLDINTEKGRANRGAIADIVSGIQSHMTALSKQGASMDTMRSTFNAHIEDFRRTLKAAGLTEAQIADLTRQYNLTPETVETTVRLTGVAESMERIHALEAELLRMQRTDYQINMGATFKAGPNVQGRASGGSVVPGRMYEVAENSKSELLHAGGKTYLMPGEPGYVEPISGSAGGSAASPSAASTMVDTAAPMSDAPAPPDGVNVYVTQHYAMEFHGATGDPHEFASAMRRYLHESWRDNDFSAAVLQGLEASSRSGNAPGPFTRRMFRTT